MFLFRYSPVLLDANSVVMRIFAVIDLVFGDQLLAEMAATAFSEEGVFGVQLHAGNVVGGMLAGAADAHVAGGNAFDGAVLVIQDLCCCETGEYLHAQAFSLLCQPAAQVAEADEDRKST